MTYREVTLLIDPEQSSAAAKQTVALVVGHELAHQWFGNFVTMVRCHFICYGQHILMQLIRISWILVMLLLQY